MFTFFGGPCVIESADHAEELCGKIKEITTELEIPFVFKASFDKANRTSLNSYRGVGLERGLEILEQIKQKHHVLIVTDIHEPQQASEVSRVVDYIQIPAFLCRQTDLLLAAGQTQKPIIVKKGQFLSGARMREALMKVYSTGNKEVFLCERGTMFGYQQLIVDMTNIVDMKALGVPVIFDATHSVQMMDPKESCSGGRPEYILPLAKSALAAGADHIFMEVHESPNKALSDGPNMLALKELEGVLRELKRVYGALNG